MKKITKFINILMYLAVGYCFGMLLPICVEAIVGDESPIGKKLIIAGLLMFLFVIAIIIHIVIHELGHLIAGLISGYRFVSFRIFSMIIAKYEDGYKLKKYSIPGTAGQCLMEPPEYSTSMPYKLYFAGGVIANSLASIVVAIVVLVFGMDTVTGKLMCMYILPGILMVVSNGIPANQNGLVNDGYNFFGICSNEQIRYLCDSLRNNARLQRGDLPSELGLDGEISEELIGKCSDISIASELCLKITLLLEKKEFEKAYDAIKKIRANKELLGLYQNELKCEQLYTELMLKRKLEDIEYLYDEEIKKYIDLTKKTMISRQRLMYAMELLKNNDVDAAQKIKANFEKMTQSYPNLGEIKLERKLIDYAIEAYQKTNFHNNM